LAIRCKSIDIDYDKAKKIFYEEDKELMIKRVEKGIMENKRCLTKKD
jgi:hypothetical protein